MEHGGQELLEAAGLAGAQRMARELLEKRLVYRAERLWIRSRTVAIKPSMGKGF